MNEPRDQGFPDQDPCPYPRDARYPGDLPYRPTHGDGSFGRHHPPHEHPYDAPRGRPHLYPPAPASYPPPDQAWNPLNYAPRHPTTARRAAPPEVDPCGDSIILPGRWKLLVPVLLAILTALTGINLQGVVGVSNVGQKVARVDERVDGLDTGLATVKTNTGRVAKAVEQCGADAKPSKQPSTRPRNRP